LGFYSICIPISYEMLKKQQSKLNMCFVIQRTKIKNFILLFLDFFAFSLVFESKLVIFSEIIFQ